MRKTLFAVALSAAPLAASAATLLDAVKTVGTIINTAIPILVALALAYFFWGLGLYILSSEDEEKRAQGKWIMIWGVIALFVMTSVFGLTKLLADTFNLSNQSTITAPSVRY